MPVYLYAIGRILEDLAIAIIEAKAKLEALVEEADVPEPNVTLGKMRR
jgi:hypothetical protein